MSLNSFFIYPIFCARSGVHLFQGMFCIRNGYNWSPRSGKFTDISRYVSTTISDQWMIRNSWSLSITLCSVCDSHKPIHMSSSMLLCFSNYLTQMLQINNCIRPTKNSSLMKNFALDTFGSSPGSGVAVHMKEHRSYYSRYLIIYWIFKEHLQKIMERNLEENVITKI